MCTCNSSKCAYCGTKYSYLEGHECAWTKEGN